MTMRYTIRRNLRSRSVRISILGRDEVMVSAPRYVSEAAIDRFVRSKSEWIRAKLAAFAMLPEHLFLKSSKKAFEAHKAAALKLATERITHFNRVYMFSYKKVSIRNQKSRWGSCSKTGTISFNYKLALLQSHLADYIVVHELCHLGEMNHSKKFWMLVARTLPDYARLRAELNGKRSRASI